MKSSGNTECGAGRCSPGHWLLLLVALVAPGANAAGVEPPALIPAPARMEACAGGLTLEPGSAVAAPAGARAQEIASFLRESVAQQAGIELAVARKGAKQRPAIELRHDPRIAGEEAYRLDIGPRGAVIAASGDRGLLWGVQTLRQLLPVEMPSKSGGAPVVLPCLHVEDAPSLAYRGQMLDVSRHFYPVEFIKRQLDVLSYYKVNTFRWHLTDDQGWRIQIKRHPKLTEVGAWRTEPDGSRHGGFYTQDEARDVVEYARQRGIMVIPEIEMPGHATAALAAYPQLACAAPPAAVATTWGVFKDIFCAGKEETFAFLQDVLDEVVALFPAPYVHIGGDEVPKDRWRDCDACQALMRREGLKDEDELQGWFVRRIQAYLRGKGRTLMGWDEILEGGADRDAVVEVWRGEAEARKALANGNRIVNATEYYIDKLPDQLTLEQVYRNDPRAGTDAAHGGQVLGAEAPLWSERVTPLNGEAMLYPRMLAFAETTWNANASDFADFRRRLAPNYRWLEAHGIAYGPEDKPLARYTLGYDRARGHWTLRAAHGFADMVSRYTLDGSAPTAASQGFAQELAIDRPGLLRVAPFRGARQALEPMDYRLASHLALDASLRLATPASPKYADAAVLADGVLGAESLSGGTWAGWEGADLDATLDFGSRRRVGRIAIGLLQRAGDWIVLPGQVSFAVSDDGRRWRTVHAETLEVDALRGDPFVRRVEWKAAKTLQARFIRVVARNAGPLPAGHVGAGHPSWIFADEIVVE